MAENKANLLAPVRALCKKEDVALNMAVLLIGDDVDDTITVDELLCSISEVVDCVQSAAMRHCKSPSIALLLELDQKVSQVTLRDQDIHVRIGVTLMPFHLVLLTYQTKQTGQRVTLAEAREKMRTTRSRTQEFLQQPGPMPREGLDSRHVPPGDHRLMKEFFNMSLHSNYKKLRPFSGSLSPSRDEGGFDLWVDQAEGQLQEWTAAGLEEVEKRRRISEALRPPASTIVRDLKLSKLQASAEDYISALEAAFGTTERGEEILLKFREMAQHDQEEPSEFIMRLNSTLRQAVWKGGAPPDRADYLWLQKFIHSLYDEMFLVSLRLKDLLHDPPSFITR